MPTASEYHRRSCWHCSTPELLARYRAAETVNDEGLLQNNNAVERRIERRKAAPLVRRSDIHQSPPQSAGVGQADKPSDAINTQISVYKFEHQEAMPSIFYQTHSIQQSTTKRKSDSSDGRQQFTVKPQSGVIFLQTNNLA